MNYDKTLIYFSHNVDLDVIVALINQFGFQEAHSLGTILVFNRWPELESSKEKCFSLFNLESEITFIWLEGLTTFLGMKDNFVQDGYSSYPGISNDVHEYSQNYS